MADKLNQGAWQSGGSNNRLCQGAWQATSSAEEPTGNVYLLYTDEQIFVNNKHVFYIETN